VRRVQSFNDGCTGRHTKWANQLIAHPQRGPVSGHTEQATRRGLPHPGNSARRFGAGPDLPVHCGVAGTTKSSTPCVFCGTTGSLSTEHVVPKWVRKALQIREPVREFSATTYVGAAETLAIVFHEVCVTFSVGCVLFHVFATGQEDADLSPDTEAWLAPKGPYRAALLQIAPSSAPLRWPPRAVFTAADREALAGRLRQGLPARP
jgi:hypothetical protein